MLSRTHNLKATFGGDNLSISIWDSFRFGTQRCLGQISPFYSMFVHFYCRMGFNVVLGHTIILGHNVVLGQNVVLAHITTRR